MNKRNIKILIIGLIISLIIIFLIIHPSVLRTPPLSRGGWNTNQIEVKSLSEKNIKVSLFVQEKKYEGEFKEGATVFDVMQKTKEENKDFDFKYTEHSGLGIFINEINGLKGGGDGYWIYYVNDKEASIGVSNYKINNGDVISWKYEK